MKLILINIFFIISQFPLLAQKNAIAGKVLDENKEGSSGASICVVNDTIKYKRKGICKSGISTVTDIDGNFQISIPREQAEASIFIGVKAIGSKPQIFTLSKEGIYQLDSNKRLKFDPDILIEKPAIYLYPVLQANILVKHEFKGRMGTTYPEYDNGWLVSAEPDGTLTNTKDQRKYEYLFWEGSYNFPQEHYIIKTGFIVKREEASAFLLEKLSFIGLNNKEINDFIVYWLPVLHQNEANLIHFRINDNIDNSSILTVTPQPDSWIRLFMEFKPIDKKTQIPSQVLHPIPRKGFTLVEWGGGKLKAPLEFQ